MSAEHFSLLITQIDINSLFILADASEGICSCFRLTFCPDSIGYGLDYGSNSFISMSSYVTLIEISLYDTVLMLCI